MSQNDENQAATPAPVPVPSFDVAIDPPDFQASQGRPLLGGSLWIFGALLWAYLVMGELVVHLELNEAFAMLIVAGALAVAWVGAVRQAPRGNVARKVTPGILGILLWAFALFVVAATCGTSRRSAVEALTVVFWVPALAAYFVGRRLTANPRLELSRRRRAGVIAAWVASSVVTALSLIMAVGHM